MRKPLDIKITRIYEPDQEAITEAYRVLVNWNPEEEKKKSGDAA
jgi:hypothetical protein